MKLRSAGDHPGRVMWRHAGRRIIGIRRMFLVLALLFFLVLPDPWDVVVGVTCTALFVVEVGFWHRRVRGQKAQTGVDRLVGATGEVTDLVAPAGQVRVLGELWEARSTAELAVGERVRVVAVDGLTLDVEPAEPAGLTSRA